jgi:8-oxo-dGTP diphosphatase
MNVPHPDGTGAAAAPHASITEVAAAVFLRPAAGMGRIGRVEYLLAQRPPGKAYAGYWEFPGGKREAGESLAEACRRELREELGVECEGLAPWIIREFVYPHAHVRIRFYRVRSWRGEIRPLEHTGIVWQTVGETPDVEPVLPANGPILKGLALPTTCAVTCAEAHGVDHEMARLDAALEAGCRLFQVRDKGFPAEIRLDFARRFVARAHGGGALVVVNQDFELARESGADGVHLTAAQLRTFQTRPDFPWVGASIHDERERDAAARLGADFAVLGPVFPTATHPGASTLGWARFDELAARSPIPLFALGGVRPGMTDIAQEHGAHGVACMRHWPGQRELVGK